MKFTPFFIGLVVVPARDEYPRHYDDLYVAWKRELTRIENTLGLEGIYTERRIGCRWTTVPINGFDIYRPPKRSHAFPNLEELIIGLASPALAVAFYKFFKEWIKARAGREIKLKFGDWEAEFNGLSQRQVINLFKVLYELTSNSKDPIRSKREVTREKRRIASVVKEQNIKAIKLEAAYKQSMRVQAKALDKLSNERSGKTPQLSKSKTKPKSRAR